MNRFVAFNNPFRYRGYYYDFETKLYYLNSRYYDPELGRFINADDIAVLDLTNITINGLNLYAYCLNNPVNEVDENGYFLWWIPIIIAAVAITTVTVVTSIASQSKTGKVNVLSVILDGILALTSTLLMVTGLGPLGMALWNGALAFVGELGNQLATEGKITFGKALLTALFSVAIGFAGKGGANNMDVIRKALIANDDYFNAMQSFMKVIHKSQNGLYKTIQGQKGARLITGNKLEYLKNKIGYSVFLKRFSAGSLELTLSNILGNVFDF